MIIFKERNEILKKKKFFGYKKKNFLFKNIIFLLNFKKFERTLILQIASVVLFIKSF